MDYSFFVYRSYSNLNSIFNILNVIIVLYRLLANKSTFFCKSSPVISLRFWQFEPHFLIELYLLKTCRKIEVVTVRRLEIGIMLERE